jgi:isoleucyl-tRNA synthetase
LEAAESQIRFVPDWGQARLEGMLEARPDWCISRQRAWGLPIPAFFNSNGQALLTEASVRAVASHIRNHGSDSWFSAGPEDLLSNYDPSEDPEAPEWMKNNQAKGLPDLRKGEDIFDVWFESGSSWNGALRERGIGFPADLYLEGSDQHRGWFQLSLLPGLGVMGQSPFKTVLTHGFMVAADGRKMSKSMGNAIEVDDVLKKNGADICRWWVSSLNYTNDIKVDWEFFRVASDEYRKIRNTIRFLLSNLNGFDPERDRYELGGGDGTSIDDWAVQKHFEFTAAVRKGYEDFQFKKVSETIFDFCNDTMSAVYFTAVKDRLYCEKEDSPKRRRTQTVLFDIAGSLIRAIAPILVHTAEEAWLALNGCSEKSEDSVHLESLPDVPEFRAHADWAAVMEFRQQVLKALEDAKSRQDGIKNSLDAGIRALVPDTLKAKMGPFRSDLADLCGVSRLSLSEGDQLKIEVLDLRNEPKCERSWKRDGTVRLRSDGGMLSDRDAEVLSV